jgi:hypothetical protein
MIVNNEFGKDVARNDHGLIYGAIVAYALRN